MPIGSGSYYPSGRFAIPRSYLWGVAFNQLGYIITPILDNQWLWTNIATPTFHAYIRFDDRFTPWSSNRWTFDHIITDCYIYNDPPGSPIPEDFRINLYYHGNSNRTMIEILLGGVDYHNHTVFNFAPPPSGYWVPQPLP